MFTQRHVSIILSVLNKRPLNIRGLIAQLDRHYWDEFEGCRSNRFQILEQLLTDGYIDYEKEPAYEFPNYELTDIGKSYLEEIK